MRIQRGKIFAASTFVLVAVGGLLFSQTLSTHAAGSYIGYWKFDESNPGEIAADESGNHNDLTPVNDPMPSTDRPSQLDTDFSDPYSTSLNGAGQYFYVDDNASLDSTASGVTLAIWVKFNNVNGSYQSIISKWHIGVQQQWTLQLNANNKIGWWTGDGGTGADNLESASTMENDTWYHIIVTAKGLSKKIYINGALEGSTTSADTALGPAVGVGLGIGAKTVGSPEYLNGLVDDVRIYGSVISDDEASQLASGVDVHPAPELTGGSSVTHEQGSSAAITDLQLTSNPTNPTVSVKLLVSHGTLNMTTTTGLTFKNASGNTISNPQTGGTLYFSGELDDLNAALATLHYTRTSGTGSDTLEASLVDPGQVFFPSNNHLYEYIPGTITWNSAKPAAEARSKYGAQGYLATITSLAENSFIQQRLTADGWIGASDSSVEGDWKWVTGPENNTLFWRGTGGGSTQGGNYANWNSGEPNNSNNEDCAQFYSNGTGWNDLPCTNTLPGYVVEYGAPDNLPSVSAKNVSITTTADTVPPTTPGTPSADAVTTDTTPTVTWAASSDAGLGLKNPAYTLEWSTSATFASVAGSATTNSTSRTPSVSLADSTWYFRVKATDAADNVATSAISDPVIIDTTPPTVPGTPTTSSSSNDNTPTYNWTASTDSGAGLAFIAYAVQWSQDTGFFGLGGQAGITENTYTIPDGLNMSDSTWYFRVKAIDAVGNESDWSDYSTVTIDTSVHDDNDGATAETEDDAPNTGDGNNDGTPDSQQSNVASFVSPVTGEYATVAASDECQLSGVGSINSAALTTDSSYLYPLGLLDFTADCGTPGFTATITQYYYNPPVGDFVLRKFANGSYQTISDVTFARQTVGGTPVLVVTYDVTDGGPLDADGAVNGIIVDPAGPAQFVPGAPNTGFARRSDYSVVFATLLVVVILSAALFIRPILR